MTDATNHSGAVKDEAPIRGANTAGAGGGNGDVDSNLQGHCSIPRADVQTADSPIYLAPAHLAMLRQASAISDEVLRARGYRTITSTAELAGLGFAPSQCQTAQVPGLLLPLHATDGTAPFCVYRPDNPRVLEDKRHGKLPDGTYPNRVLKYEVPKGTGTRLDCPPTCRPLLGNPGVPLWMTEGQKKADALATVGLCSIALLGVWNFKGKNDAGGTALLADFDSVALNGRDVRLVFDSDVMTKPGVRAALDRLTEHLQRRGAHVTAVYLPAGAGGKVGVDDYLAAGHSVQDLEALVEAPRPAPTAAPPRVELLDVAPATIRRPLTKIDGYAYAAVWLHCRVTQTESVNNKGEIVTFNPPRVTQEQRLFVVRNDGRMFGEGGDAPLTELGLDVALPEVPPGDKLWRAPAVKRYRAGARPNPAEVFKRVVGGVDYHIDFNRSLAEQETMAEMAACYVLATYLLDAFNVVGFLWPNGDKGSGKSQFLYVVASMAYLGQVVLAGGSYASLRDMADYGACLAFDDAENLSDPKQTDPDKRALLLAGNRRGSTVSVKELAADKTWRTRYVNAFCPRMFSAIALPDGVLASRTIVVPLIRTADREKANSDPLAYEKWPHDRGALLDDLWALGLAYLPEVGGYEAAACAEAHIAGRNLEPWRAILTVAKWLDATGMPTRKGIDGQETTLYQRMEALAVSYQTERPELETTDVTVLTLRGLSHCATSATSATNRETLPFTFSTKLVRLAVAGIASDEEIDLSWMGDEARQSMRIGRALGRLRIGKAPRPGGKGSRQWSIKFAELRALLTSYGLPIPDALKPPETLSPTSGTSGISGTSGTDGQAPGPFVPSSDWQDLPDGYVCEPGAESRANMTTGRKEARWPALGGDGAGARQRLTL